MFIICKLMFLTSTIETNYMFQPIAVESLGPINVSGCAFWSQAFH